MKTTLLTFIIIASAGASAPAQTASPSPSPAFDASIFTKAQPIPNPAPLTTDQVIAGQNAFAHNLPISLSYERSQIERAYMQSLALFAPDSRLTTQQKVNAMTPAQFTAAITFAWQLYSLIKTANPASIVPPPSIPMPSPAAQ